MGFSGPPPSNRNNWLPSQQIIRTSDLTSQPASPEALAKLKQLQAEEAQAQANRLAIHPAPVGKTTSLEILPEFSFEPANQFFEEQFSKLNGVTKQKKVLLLRPNEIAIVSKNNNKINPELPNEFTPLQQQIIELIQKGNTENKTPLTVPQLEMMVQHLIGNNVHTNYHPPQHPIGLAQQRMEAALLFSQTGEAGQRLAVKWLQQSRGELLQLTQSLSNSSDASNLALQNSAYQFSGMVSNLLETMPKHLRGWVG